MEGEGVSTELKKILYFITKWLSKRKFRRQFNIVDIEVHLKCSIKISVGKLKYSKTDGALNRLPKCIPV